MTEPRTEPARRRPPTARRRAAPKRSAAARGAARAAHHGDRQAARAHGRQALPAAGAGQAGRRRAGPEGTRRHGPDLAAPALHRVLRGGHDQHLPAVHGPVHQRAAGGAGQRQRDAGRGQGALVLRGAPGAAGLLPPDRGGRARAHGHPRRRGARAVHRPGPPRRRRLTPAERPQDGRDAVHHRRAAPASPSPSWAPSSAAPGTPGPCRGRASTSRCRSRWATGSSPGAGAAGADRRGACARCAAASRRACRAASSSGARSARPSACGSWRSLAAPSASCGRTCRAASAARITLGDIDTVAANPAVPGADPRRSGAPAYFAEARSYVQLLDPTLGFQDGDSPDGSGQSTNVRTLYQRCPHLGCKPNFCTINYWFECPCHGSRYDRLGTKVQELGPAPRSLDRFAQQGGERRPDRRHQQDHPRSAARSPSASPVSSRPRRPASCI